MDTIHHPPSTHVLCETFPRSRSPANQPSSSLPQRYQAGHDDDGHDDDGGDDDGDDDDDCDHGIMMMMMITWANILTLIP